MKKSVRKRPGLRPVARELSGTRPRAPLAGIQRLDDPALAALMGSIEQLAERLDATIGSDRPAPPPDPTLARVLDRLGILEEKLDRLWALVSDGVSLPAAGESDRGVDAAGLPPAPALEASAVPDILQVAACRSAFAKLDIEDCTLLTKFMDETLLTAGSVLFTQGQLGDALYLVKSGLLEIYKSDTSAPLCVAEVRSGGLVGEMALVEDMPRSASVRARETSHLLVLSRASFDDLEKAYPQVAAKLRHELLRLLSARLRETTDKLIGR